MEFEDGSIAVINDDFSVTYSDKNNKIVVISGFPSRSDADNFCLFGDFLEKDNDYIVVTKPNFELIWNHK